MKSVALILALPAIVAMTQLVTFRWYNRSNGRITSSGIEREYFVHVPRSYDGTKAVPLVISMHGGGGSPVQQRDLSRWIDLAEERGFIVVYPAGRKGPGTRSWAVRQSRALDVDVRFISDLISRLESQYKIDPRRIYANGLSNGAGMSFVLSCTLANRIAAVGLVSAAQTLRSSWCARGPAMPVVAFQGTEDPMVPYKGGGSWVTPVIFPDYEQFMADWAKRNRCNPQPSDRKFAADVTRRDYTGCPNGADVVLYTIHGGGHVWPGGATIPRWFAGIDSGTIHASRVMWEFFEAHPLH